MVHLYFSNPKLSTPQSPSLRGGVKAMKIMNYVTLRYSSFPIVPLWVHTKPTKSQVRVANAFKRAGNERHRRLSLLAEASSNSGRPTDSNNHWWAKKSDSEGVKMNNMKPAAQPLLEGDENDTHV